MCGTVRRTEDSKQHHDSHLVPRTSAVQSGSSRTLESGLCRAKRRRSTLNFNLTSSYNTPWSSSDARSGQLADLHTYFSSSESAPCQQYTYVHAKRRGSGVGAESSWPSKAVSSQAPSAAFHRVIIPGTPSGIYDPVLPLKDKLCLIVLEPTMSCNHYAYKLAERNEEYAKHVSPEDIGQPLFDNPNFKKVTTPLRSMMVCSALMIGF